MPKRRVTPAWFHPAVTIDASGHLVGERDTLTGWGDAFASGLGARLLDGYPRLGITTAGNGLLAQRGHAFPFLLGQLQFALRLRDLDARKRHQQRPGLDLVAQPRVAFDHQSRNADRKSVV